MYLVHCCSVEVHHVTGHHSPYTCSRGEPHSDCYGPVEEIHKHI